MSLEDLLSRPCGQQAASKLSADAQNEIKYANDEGYLGKHPPSQDSLAAKVANSSFEIYIGKVLSGPITLGINPVSLAFMTSMRFPETLASIAVSQVLYPKAEQLKMSEFYAEATATQIGIQHAVKFIGDRYRVSRGRTDLTRFAGNTDVGKMSGIPPELMTRSKLDSVNQYITSETWGAENSFIGPAIDLLGFAASIPGTVLGTTDLVYKVINFHASVGKLSMRQAEADMQTRMAEDPELEYDIDFVNNRFETLYQYGLSDDEGVIYKEAIADGDRRAFTADPNSAIGKWIVESSFPGFRWVVPLRRAIVGAMESSVEHTPLSLLPALPHSRTYKDLHSDSAARKASAWGRMASGSVLIGGLATALWGYLDGSEPMNPYEKAEWKQNGHKANSIRTPWLIGIDHIPFRALGYAEAPLRALARIQQLAFEADWDTSDDSDTWLDSSFMQAVIGVADVVYNDQASKDIYQFLNAINSSIRDHTPAAINKWVGRKFNTLLVGNAMYTGITKQLDPYAHAPDSVLDGLVARLPGLSNVVARRVDFGGNYILNSGHKDPSQYYEFNGVDPVSTRMRELKMKRPKTMRTKERVKTTPKEFEQWQVYAGKGDPSRPQLYPSMNQRLAKVMASPMFEMYPSDEKRRILLMTAIKKQRKQANLLLKADKRFSFGQRWKERQETLQKMNRPF